MRFSFAGEQVDWIMNTSFPLTLTFILTSDSPSLNLSTSAFPRFLPSFLAIFPANTLLALPENKIRFLAGFNILSGWGGRIRTYAWRHQKPLPYRLATPHYLLSSSYIGDLSKLLVTKNLQLVGTFVAIVYASSEELKFKYIEEPVPDNSTVPY